MRNLFTIVVFLKVFSFGFSQSLINDSIMNGDSLSLTLEDSIVYQDPFEFKTVTLNCLNKVCNSVRPDSIKCRFDSARKAINYARISRGNELLIKDTSGWRVYSAPCYNYFAPELPKIDTIPEILLMSYIPEDTLCEWAFEVLNDTLEAVTYTNSLVSRRGKDKIILNYAFFKPSGKSFASKKISLSKVKSGKKGVYELVFKKILLKNMDLFASRVYKLKKQKVTPQDPRDEEWVNTYPLPGFYSSVINRPTGLIIRHLFYCTSEPESHQRAKLFEKLLDKSLKPQILAKERTKKDLPMYKVTARNRVFYIKIEIVHNGAELTIRT